MIACVHRWCGACCEGAPLIICPPTGYTSDRQTLKMEVKPCVIPRTIKIRTAIIQNPPPRANLHLSMFVSVLVSVAFALL